MSVTPIRKLALASALPLALALSAVVSAPAMAADPTADQVYSAARSGHVDDALTQMQQVLKDHPGSAKAHFVEAELLAKANRLAEARTELAKAEQLQPGLPFVSQHAVTALKAQLAVTSSTGTAGRSVEVQRQGSGFPWIPVIVIAGLVFLVLAFIRRRNAANAYYEAPPANPGYGYGNTGPQGGPWGAGGYQGGGGYGAPPQQGGGSGILGALAGGAAAGAGFAAGEAVIDRVFGDHDRDKTTQHDAPAPSQDDDRRNTNQDMGGNDFGLSDSGSWDDGGSGSSNDDW